MRPKEALRLLKHAAMSWSEDYAPSMGAALSYYTLFSIAPLLMVVIAVAGLAFGDQAARGEISSQLEQLMGGQGARAVEDLLQAADKPREGAIATAIGVAMLLLGATTVFGELQNSLDRIWRAPARASSRGWLSLLRTRLLSFGMVLGVAFLLMVSLVLSAALSALGGLWAFPGWEPLAHALDAALSFGLTTLLFALIYKLIPRVHVAWRDVWIGAGVTAALFAVGKLLIGLYIGKSALASSFGAAGSLVVMMVWVYYSAQIFLLGAEFTWVYAHEHGSRRAGTVRSGEAAQGRGMATNPYAPPAAPLASAAERAPVSKAALLLLTFFLGGIGAHKFYLGKWWQGALYLAFFWTWIPALVALIEFIVYAFTSAERLNEKYSASGSRWALAGLALFALAVAGLAAAIAIPAHYDRVYRSQVAGAMSSVQPWQAALTEHFAQHKRLPESIAGLPGELVLGANGVLTWTFPAEAGALAGSTLVFRPRAEGGALAWDCTGGTLERRYRSHACR